MTSFWVQTAKISGHKGSEKKRELTVISSKIASPSLSDRNRHIAGIVRGKLVSTTAVVRSTSNSGHGGKKFHYVSL